MKRLGLLFIILAGALLAWSLAVSSPRPMVRENMTPPREPAPIAPLTQERTIEGIGTKDFAALVSFTGMQFEPAAVSVEAGDIVRFFNSSRQPMTLSLQGAPKDIAPGDYFEFSFAAGAAVTVTELGSGVSGTITIQ